jgi:Flp pilus assembly protein TadD
MTRLGVLAAFLGPALLATPAFASAPARAPTPPRVIVVGWDGADWGLLDPLLKEGKLPNLARLVVRGRTYDLATFEPMASPLVWTTIATGRTPVDHGVADFRENDPRNRMSIPVTSRSRKVPAVWNAASARGLRVGVVGWWATWPAEKVNGFLVSDRIAPVLFDPESLARSPALSWPEGIADGARLILKREGNPPYEDVARGLAVTRTEFDAAVAAGKDLQDPVTGYRKILGATRVIGRVAIDLYDREKPDLLMAYFQGTDEIGHVLGRFRPPRLPGVTDEEVRRFGTGVAALYGEADRILGELLERADRDGATLLLLSDHGFRWGTDRPGTFSGVQIETAYLWHRTPGVLIAAGPAVTPSGPRGKASVFDIAPTLARLLGLPPDPAWEGRPVAGLVARAPAPVSPKGWATFATVERLVPVDRPADEKRVADEFTKKLISLGYLTGPETAAVESGAASRAGTETPTGLANLGTFLRERGRPQEAVPYYRKALEIAPAAPKTWMNLSAALLALSRLDESDEAFLSSLRNGYHDPDGAIERRAETYRTKAPNRRFAFLRRSIEAAPGRRRPERLLAGALFEAHDCAGAEPLFRKLVGADPSDVTSLNGLAVTSLCLGRVEEARTLMRQSLARDPNQPALREGLSGLDAGPPRR